MQHAHRLGRNQIKYFRKSIPLLWRSPWQLPRRLKAAHWCWEENEGRPGSHRKVDLQRQNIREPGSQQLHLQLPQRLRVDLWHRCPFPVPTGSDRTQKGNLLISQILGLWLPKESQTRIQFSLVFRPNEDLISVVSEQQWFSQREETHNSSEEKFFKGEEAKQNSREKKSREISPKFLTQYHYRLEDGWIVHFQVESWHPWSHWLLPLWLWNCGGSEVPTTSEENKRFEIG